jgi:hypothetical protein
VSHSETYTDTGPTTAYYQGVEAGEKAERERIINLLEQLDSEWRNWLHHYLQRNNLHEIARYRNYVLACADLRDMVSNPNELFKGEQK